jgi:epothilone polyketide synthase D
MGEVAAACVAGALSLEDGAAVICRRSALLRRVSGKGAMALVELTVEAAAAELAGFEDRLGVAVSNSRRTTVLSGDPGALDEVVARLEGRGIFCRRVKVDVASHSPQMDALLDELRAKLEGIKPRAATVPLRSTVSGATLAGPELTAGYWADNLRAPVRFGQAIESLLADGFTLFVEMSPHPILVPAVEEIRQAAGVPGLAAGSLRREQPERRTMLDSLGALHCHGHPLDPKRLFPGGARRVALPTYPWERVPCWLDVSEPSRKTAPRAHAGGHPLLGIPTELSTHAGTWVCEVVLDPKRLPWMPDHRIQGAALFPAAGYIEMALAVGAEVALGASIEVADVDISQVLALPETGGVVVQVVASAHALGSWRVQVASRGAGERDAAEWVVHARATVRRVDREAAVAQADLATWKHRLGEPMDIAALYATFAAAGLEYGPAFRGILELRRGETEALARVDLPAAGGSAAPYRIHPSLLDGCFQVMEGILADGSAATWLPVRIESLRVCEPVRGPLWCRATLEPGTSSDPDRRSADLAIFAESGALVAEVVGLQVRRVAERAAPRQGDEWLLALDWEPRPVPPAAVARGRWLLVGDGAGIGDALGRSLEAAGHTVVRAVHPGTAPAAAGVRVVDETNVEGLRSLLLEAFAGAAPTAIVHLRSLERGDDPDPIEAAIARGCDSVLAIVKAVTSMALRDPPRLWVVTRRAQPMGDADVSFAQAPVLGLARVIAMEHSELRCGRIDLDGVASPDDVRALHAELVADDDEDEVAWRAGARSALRLARVTPSEGPSSRIEPPGGRPFVLRIGQPGVIDRLELGPLERRPPGPGEVEIEVEAAGINFRDVLLTLGVVPDEAGYGASAAAVSRDRRPGIECAGRVVSVGEGVAQLVAGDDVIALAPRGAMASHVTTPAALVARRPAAFSPSQGASIPIVYLTAWYALEKVARLQRGERVLIHAATGGVGLAAVQWAQHVGAEIYATAGSAEKRALLEQMGVRFVSDSRSDRFVDDVRTWTNGAGVDVVLNSLSGDLIAKGFGLLRPYGRFVELGKRDYYANEALGLRPFLKGLSFSLVDLHGMLVDRPGWVGDLLRELLEEFDAGSFSPPRVETFPISRVQDAFRKMAQGRHVGKLAVALADGDARIHLPAEQAARIRSDGSYLVTGGLGGLGLSLAEWLARRGAGHIVLVGRSGATTDAQSKAIAAIEGQGTSVTVAAADVAQRAALDAVIVALPEDRPLRGVFHAAGLLDDGLLADQTPARLRKAMAPKVQGAWNLHTLTRHHATLDFFVLYASVNGIIGSPAQGNYAAANAFLDALAHHRRAQGLPAIAIDWGVFAEVGLAAAEETRGKRLEGRGMRGLTPADGIVALERVIAWNPRQVVVARLDVHQWVEFYPSAAGSRTLSRLLQDKAEGRRRGSDGGLIERLAAADPESRLRIVEGALREQVGKVLRIRPESIGREVPLAKLGMDSLMGLELRNRIEAILGVRLPAGALWTYPTLAALTTRLAAKEESETAAAVEAPAPTPGTDAMANRVATMGSTDLMSLLDTLLESAAAGPK